VYAIATGQKQNRTKDEGTFELDLDSDVEPLHFDTRSIDEAKDILDVILHCIRGLLRLSFLIRKATPRDRWNRALQVSKERFDDQFDIRHVSEKFPKLNRPDNAWLKVRLGRAITQRRQFIRYCREHKDHLSGEEVDPYSTTLEERLEVPEPGNEEAAINSMAKSEALTTKQEPTVTEVSTKASTLQVAKLEVIRADGNDCDDDDGTSTVSSAVSSADPTDEGVLRLPSLQDVSHGQVEFECPFCFTIQSIKRERKWR